MSVRWAAVFALGWVLVGSACDGGGSAVDVLVDGGAEVEGGSDAGADSSADSDTVADAGSDADVSADTGPVDDGFPVCDISAATDELVVGGDYFLAVEVVPLNGLNIYFRAHVVGGVDSVLELELYSLSPDLTVESAGPIGRFCDVPVDEDGRFIVAFDQLTIPESGTTVGVEVDLLAGEFTGRLVDSEAFCGGVSGVVPLLGFNIETSTFYAVPLGTQESPPRTSCEAAQAQTWEPIATCPTLSAGVNAMTSADLERELTIVLPEDIGVDEVLPLVVLHHGLGSSAANILDYSGMAELAVSERFILVAPSSARNASDNPVFPAEWNFLASRFDTDNQDLVFFDDIVKCASEQLAVDPDRVYATGMSAGGLWTSFLTLHRSDVLAATAPFSGGYLLVYPETLERNVPVFAPWGGVTDIEVDLNFHDSVTTMVANLRAAGSFVVGCNHGQGHTWPEELSAPAWEFLSAFELGDTANPFGEALPASFPTYCELP